MEGQAFRSTAEAPELDSRGKALHDQRTGQTILRKSTIQPRWNGQPSPSSWRVGVGCRDINGKARDAPRARPGPGQQIGAGPGGFPPGQKVAKSGARASGLVT